MIKMLGMKTDKLDEKYRPKYLKGVLGNKEHIDVIQGFMNNKEMPHILLHGQPGIGKTTTAHCILNETLGKLSKKQQKIFYKEYNASTSGKIQVIRDEIIAWLEKFNPKYNLLEHDIKFGYVILDELDSSSDEFQHGLRRVMDDYSYKVRFILCCNYINKIIGPIQSRCKMYHMKPISPDIIIERIKEICKLEKIRVTDEALTYLVSNVNGDMRKILNELETVKVLSQLKKEPLTVEDFKKTDGLDKLCTSFVLECRKCNFDNAQDKLIKLYREGWELRDLIKIITGLIRKSKTINSLVKSELCIICMDIEQNMIHGGDPITVGNGFVGRFVKIFKTMNWKQNREVINSNGKKRK
jgi:DNA polymerase III delta prime subunit